MTLHVELHVFLAGFARGTRLALCSNSANADVGSFGDMAASKRN